VPTAANPGYSGTPLTKKLGIGPGDAVSAVGAPLEYQDWLGPLPAGATISKKVTSGTTLVHIFTAERSELLQHLQRLRASLKPDMPVWVSWPKKSSKVKSTVTEDVIRELALPLGYVDIKVCAVSDVWSGLKLVVRKELRQD
jgi:hypothetical protein